MKIDNTPTADPESDLLTKVLATPMKRNDAGAATVRDYVLALAVEVWREGEGFSGKRPFGNSDWESEVMEALEDAGLVDTEDGWEAGHHLVTRSIQSMITGAVA